MKTLSHLRLITLIHSLNAIQVAIPFFQILIFHFVVGITGPVVVNQQRSEKLISEKNE